MLFEWCPLSFRGKLEWLLAIFGNWETFRESSRLRKFLSRKEQPNARADFFELLYRSKEQLCFRTHGLLVSHSMQTTLQSLNKTLSVNG